MIGTCQLLGLRLRFCKELRGRMLGGGGFGGRRSLADAGSGACFNRDTDVQMSARRGIGGSAAVCRTALWPRRRRAYSAIRGIT